MKTAPGWWWRFPVMCAVVGGFFAALAPTIGWVLAHASDLIGGAR